MKPLKIHPAAKMLPSMSAGQYEELRADIEKNGLMEPIWVCGGKVLDGRNRERACRELGIEIQTREYHGNNPEIFVLSANLVRRHLTVQQRNGLIRRLARIHPEMSSRRIAATVGVDHKTVERERGGEIPHVPRKPMETEAKIREGLRVGADGKRYPMRAAPATTEVKLSTLVSAKDLEFHRFFKFISTLHPNELTEATAKLAQLQEQVERIRALITPAAAAAN